MRSLSTAELLTVWESGLVEPTIRWALTLLSLSCPEIPKKSLENLSIGRRDTLLFALRERIFGSKLSSLVTCPNCHERLELTLNTAEICLPQEQKVAKQFSAVVGEFEVKYRLPNSLDLLAISGKDSTQAKQQLIDLCILEVRRGTETFAVGQIPAGTLDPIIEEMAKNDPQANVELNVSCALCDHQWEATLDIVSFLWIELNAWSIRLLRQVHDIASAYGWNEADILNMTPLRRQSYLELIGS